MKVPTIIAVFAIVLGGPVTAQAQPGTNTPIELSDGTKLTANPVLPKLELTNPQREQVRKAVLTEQNEVQLAITQAARDFAPAVGAKLPGGVEAQALPQPVQSEIPQLRDYWYVKMKDQVLIVDGMSRQIVDLFSGTQPVS